MQKLIKVSILSISLLVILSGSVVSPALGEIRDTFIYVDSSLIKMILTLPSIVLIPFSIISGRLSLQIKKRTLLIIGLIFYLIGGLGAGIWESIYIMLVFRGVLGIGMGLLIPLSTSLIADFYIENEKTKMMGYSNAVANLGGIMATLISGWLSLINWRFSFIIYSIAFIVLLLIIFGLPEPHNTMRNEKVPLTINNKILVLSVFAFFLNVAFYSFLTNISIFLKAENIGRADSAGIATSFLTLAGFLSGIFIKSIRDYLKYIIVSFGIGCMSVGFLLLSDSYTLILVYASAFLIGLGLGILKPIIFIKTTEITPKFSNSFSLSIITSSMYFGKFMSPFILDFVGNLMKNSDSRFTFHFLGICFLIFASVSLIIIFYPIKIFKLTYK